MKSFLLLQARHCDDPMRAHERGCFATALNVPAESITAVDIVERTPTAADLAGKSAVLIGGSGSYGARGDDAWLHRAAGFLREQVIEPGHPMFAVCFGLQLLGRALGVDVINDSDHREVGSFEVEITEAAGQCELFGDLPSRIWVQQGHNDRLTALPEGAVLFAHNANAPVQAMRLIGKPIWATQFHPELTCKDNTTRYRHYISAYGGGYEDESQDPVLSNLRDTPQPTALLRKFGEMVLAGRI